MAITRGGGLSAELADAGDPQPSDDVAEGHRPQDDAAGAIAPETEAEDPALEGPAADEPSEGASAPAFADWREVAEAVESGELSGEGFKPAGSGAAEDPYVLGTPEALAWWALLRADSHARLEADLDLTARDGEPLPWPGDVTLAGELDGRGHAVAFATQGAGLFAEVAETGAVRWLALGRTAAEARAAADAGEPAAEVASAGALAGSVAGASRGEIEGVANRMPVGFSAEAPAGAERSAGGIVAVNDGAIRDCANLGAVSSDAAAGDSAAAGIAARGAGSIATSYNAGDVKAAQNAAYVMTLLDAEGGYASVVDDATCYLAPGEGAAYEGVSEAGRDRPGALSASELAEAAERLNAGREGEAAAWSAGGDATNGFPVPSEPKDPDAQASPALFSAEPRAATYASWLDVGKAVYDGTLTGANFLPAGKGAQASHYIIKTPEALAAFSYAAAIEASPLKNDATSAPALESYVDIDSSVTQLDLFGSAYSGTAKQTDASGLVTNIDDALLWWPIGLPEDTTASSAVQFTGVFNGNGCTLSAMRCGFSDLTSWSIGFITSAKEGALIENVRVGADSKVVSGGGAGAVVGSLIGDSTATQGSTVRNCTNAGIVQGMGSKAAGGIVGVATGKSGAISHTIEGCSNSGAVTATSTGAAGGIVGQMTFSSVFDCTNSGSVEGKNLAGGIGANVGKTQFSRCFNEGSVTAAAYAGGIAGTGALGFESCGNAGAVTVKGGTTDGATAGGIGGVSTAASGSTLVIENCYNIGTVSNEEAGARAAGLVGMPTLTATPVDEVVCTASNSYNAGIVLASNGGEAYALVGPQKGSTDLAQGITRSTCFYADDLDGADPSTYLDKSITGLTAKHTADMKTTAFAKELNGGKYIGDAAGTTSTIWTTDAQKNGVANLKNSGFPVFGNFAMLASWDAVGAAVEAGTVGTKPTEQEVTWSDGATGQAYVISNAEQLAWFSYMVRTENASYFGKNVQLADNIDLAGSNYTGAETVADDYSNCLEWLPIGGGSSGASYRGVFDGAGKVVRNLYVNQPASKNVGLIGYAQGATVKGVGLESGRLVAKGYLGGLVGFAQSVVKVADCWNAASIERTGTGTLEHSGGIVGGNENAGNSSTRVEISRCYNKGSVYSADTGGDSAIGGIAGYVPGYSSIANCYNMGSVSGARQAGGIVGGGGMNATNSANYTKVTNCYNAATVERGSQANSAIAAWRCIMSNCYMQSGSEERRVAVSGQAKMVTADELKSWGAAYQLNGGDGVKPFADVSSTWRTDTANVNGGYPVLCASGESLASASTWNDVGLWVDVFAPGNKPGETMGAFQIDTPQALAWYAYKVGQESLTYQAKNVTLTADIDLQGASFVSSGAPRWVAIPAFTGTFDGSGHAIANMTAIGGPYNNTALIRNLTNGTVKNLSVSATLRGWYVGCIAVTANNATIQDCTANLVYHSTSSEHGGYYIGYAGNNFGRVAWNATNGTVIERCLGTGSISDLNPSHSDKVANGRGGGIAGRLDARSTIRDCANQGSLSPSRGTCLGGIAGQNDGTIENCYNIASLNKRWPSDASVLGDIMATGSGTVRNCYASTSYTAGDTTNDDGSIALKHLTAAQMQTRGFAVNLNGNTSGAGTAWTWGAGDTYPTFGELPTVNWQDVGGFVYNDEGAFGSFKPTTGTGASDADAIELGTAEAMAYASYATSVKAGDTAPGASLAWKGVCFKLADDIDLAATYGGADTKWTGIGSSETFSGSFDGQGHAVRNMSGENSGLFGSFSGTARNARLEKSDVASTSIAGALAENVFEARIENCSVASDVTVHALAQQAGGLVGAVRDTTFKDCWSRAAVKSDSGAAAGFVGYARSGSGSSSFVNCYSAPVSVEGAIQSGVFGTGDSDAISAENCYWLSGTGLPPVVGGTVASGLDGKDELSMRSQAFALELNATRTGDAAPWAWNPLKNGGYPALGKPPLDTELKTWGDVGARQTEDELKRTEVELDANGFCVAKAVRDALPSGGDYTPALEGTGALGDEYVVRTPEALAWFAYKTNSEPAAYGAKHVQLGASIDLTGVGYGGTSATPLQWVPIMANGSGHGQKTGNYSGTFDGRGNTVSHMYQHNGSAADASSWGLVAFASGGTVENVALEAVDIDVAPRSTFVTVGGVVGQLTAGAKVLGCAVKSGTIKAKSSTIMTGGIVGDIHQGGGSIENCYARADVGENAAGKYGAGLLGRPCQAGPTIKNSYFAGKASNPVCYTSPGNVTCENVLYDTAVYGSTASAKTGVTGVTTAQLQSWGAAYQLNGGDGTEAKNPTALTTWRKAASDSENGGFPVLVKDDATGDDAHLQPASDWGDVGLWVDAFATDRKPAGDGAATGSGATGPFQIDSPEAFAWFAYKVNANAAADQNAVLVEDVDLAGNRYTGESGTGSNFDACLAWDPIGAFDNSDGVTKSVFRDRFDGQGHEVSSLRLSALSKFTGGLFGYATTSSSIVRTGIASGAMADVFYADTWGSLVGLSMGEVSDCYSRVDLTSSSPVISPEAFGGLLGSVEGGSVSRCYYAGASPANKRCVGKVEGGTVGSDVYFVGEAADDANATALAQDQLASWGAAYALGGGDGSTALGELKTWRAAADSNADGKLTSDDENSGFPVLCRDGESMSAALSWSDVGAWIDTFAPEKKPVRESVTWRDGGNDTAYRIDDAEQLAWLAYKVNQKLPDGLPDDEHGAVLSADVDLSGSVYTGKPEGVPGADFENCLSWIPVGTAENYQYDGLSRLTSYGGRFDGRGHVVSNLRCAGEEYGGLFGLSDVLSVIERVGIASGHVDGTEWVGGLAGESWAAVADCYSLAEVAGASAAHRGGLIGLPHPSEAIKNCYYAGPSGLPAYVHESSTVPRGQGNNYYLSATPDDSHKSKGQLGVAAGQLQGWAAAYQLNEPLNADGTQKALGDLKTWRAAKDTDGDGKLTSADENGGFPVLVKDDATGDDAHLQAASDWGDVGLWVDAFATDRKPDAKELAWRDGSSSSVGYGLGSPEQLAWFAYKVNQGESNGGLAAANQNAVLTDDIDLSGYAYASKPEGTPGTDFENCIEWVPLGVSYDTSFMGRFDGRGYAVSNLHLVCDALDDYAGFFGCAQSSVIERAALVSGALDVQKGDTDSVATFVALPSGEIRDCYSLVDVVGPESTVSMVGGFVGDGLSSTGSGPVRFVSCYYGGNHGKFFGWWEGGDPNDAISNSYLLGSQDRPSGEPWSDGTLAGLTADQLASWGAAYQLNDPLDADGAQKALGDLKTWRVAKDADGDGVPDENDGFPVLVKDGDAVASMQPASDWSDVGLWVDAFATGKKPAEIDAPDSWNAAAGTKAYGIESADQLAWLAYKVNTDTVNFGSKNAVLADGLDLFGEAYTGKALDEAADLKSELGTKALRWVAMGQTESYAGTFDGQGKKVRHLYSPAKANKAGLIGSLAGAVRNVAVEASSVSAPGGANDAAGAVVASIMGAATIERCSAGKDVSVSAGKAGGIVGYISYGGTVSDCASRAAVAGAQAGGIMGYAYSATIKNSYFAGSAAAAMVCVSEGTCTFSDNYYQDGSATGASQIAGSATKLSAAEMTASKGSSLASKLNAGRTGKDAPWRGDSKGANDAYPVLVLAADIMADWGEVGARQSEDELRRTEAVDGAMGAVHDARPSGGNYVPALEGSGVEGDPYVVRTPEALAWWGYQVNHNNRGFTHDAAGAETATEFLNSHLSVGASIDLAGLAYTGASKVGTNHVNCLEWSPISYYDYDGGVEVIFNGTFDGGGYPIANVRLVGRAGNNTGFFGDFESSPTVRRVLLTSGTLDATGASAGWKVGTLAACGAGGSITDCASLVDVVGLALADSAFGGFIGETSGIAVSNCYYGGAIDSASPAKPFLDDGGSSYAPVNCYYVGNDAADPYATGVAADQLASWGAAYALNGGDGTEAKNPTALTTWRKAASDSENGGFPVLVKDDATGDAAHLQPASNWSDVGLWVDAFATDKKPAGDGAATGSGATGPFRIDSPEAFAWFAYKVNANAAADRNAVLVEDVDLAGNRYTGESGTGSNFDACLAWDPIGAFDHSDGVVRSVFRGRFDGQGHEVSSLRLSALSKFTGGLFGYTDASSSIVRTGIASGAMADMYFADTWGSLVGLSKGEVSDCYSRVDLTSSSPVILPEAFGGLLGRVEGGSVSRCYYAGANPANKRCVGKVEGGTVGSDVYFVGEAADDANATALAQDQLASWGAAYALGGGDGVKMPTDLKTWRMPTTDSDNGGYPVLVPNDATGDAAHLQNAADWSDVGGWVALTGTFKPSVGTGATAFPFELASREALAWFSYMVNEHGSEATPSGGVKWGAASAKLTVDLDMSAAYGGADTKWVPIGNGGFENGALTNAYSGTFDGNSHTVTNLVTGTGVNAAGLVGTLEGTVKGVGMAASSLTGGGAAGGIVGMAGQDAKVERCTVAKDVTVSSTGYTGGLAGLMYNTASAKDCWTRATVAAGTTSGGFVGSLEGDAVLSSCYAAAGAVDGSGKKGSFAAYEGTTGAVERCCFQKASGLGAVETGNAGKFSEKTAFQMKSPMMVVLLNDGRMGASNVWTQSAEANDGYPVLGSTVVTVTTWGHVGSGQSEDELRRTEVAYDAKGFGTMDAVHDEQPSGGSYLPALEGSGVEGDPYVVRTPEALAWWTYMVNYNSLGLTHDSSGAETSIEFVNSYVLVDAPIDLAGFAYTSASEVGANHKNCLEWSSISHEDPDGYAFFAGNFDGGGLPIANVRLEGGNGYGIGFFGPVEGSLNVKRVLLASGTLDVSGTTQSNVKAGTMIAGALGGTMEDCASLVNIVGTSANVSPFGGFAGLRDGLVIQNCYYGGTIDPASGAKSFLGYNDSGQAPVNCYYVGNDADDPYAKGVTSDQLSSWGAAYALNGGNGSKALSTMASWRAAADGENGGFPVPCKDGETMGAASNWGDVGLWVDAFATDRKPKSESVAWRDGGNGMAYKIDDAEQLAWLAYKVNQLPSDGGLAEAEQNALLVNDIDLYGSAYTGKPEGAPGGNFENCLEWSPMGVSYDTAFVGRFDGRGCTVDNLRYKGEAGTGQAGLFGCTKGGSVVERVGIASGFVTDGEYVGSLVGVMYGAVRDCYSFAEVGSGYFYGGLIGSPEDPAVIWNCYYAGPSDVSTYGMEDSTGDRGNNYYLSATPDDSLEYYQEYGRTADQLKSWGAAYQLNDPLNADGTHKALGDLKTWRVAADGENGGFPVLIKDGDAVASMQAAKDWAEVGAWVDAFGADDATETVRPLRPQEVDAPASWGAAAGTKAYAIESAEDLAWLFETASSSPTSNALITKPIDLAGNAYTGKSGTGADFDACLEWSSGYVSGSVFDGGGQPITNLHQQANAMGFLGRVSDGATVQNVALRSGLLHIAENITGPRGAFATTVDGSTIENCFSRVGLKNDVASIASAGFVWDMANSHVKGSYFAGTLSGNASACFGSFAGSDGTLFTDQNVTDGAGVEKLTTAELQSWNSAYRLNGDSFVGKKQADGTGLAHTTWTVDSALAPKNDGYPVFGDLVAEEKVVEVDANDALDSADGTIAVTLPVSLAGTVKLADAPDVSGLGDPAAGGAALTAATDVKDNFSNWGTGSANGKVALTAGTANLLATSPAGTQLSTTGLPSVTINLAAAYSSAAERTVSFVAMDDATAYCIKVKIPAVAEKTLDVTVPVETGASFELAPDGDAHENEMAKAASELKSNNALPVSGGVTKVEALPEGEVVTYPGGATATVGAVLSPGLAKLAPTPEPITGEGRVRLLVGAAPAAGAAEGDAATALTPLADSLYYDPASKTVPLAFAVPGNEKAAWKWGMDYTGTFLEPDGVFGFRTEYSFGLPSADVPVAALGKKA